MVLSVMQSTGSKKKKNQSVYDDNKLKKEDSAAGILNIGLQGFLRLFKPAEPE